MITIINLIIKNIGLIISAVVLLLPESPFEWAQGIDSNLFRAINWIFPIDGIIAHLTLYCTAVLAYYLIRVVLRWVKVAGD